MKKLIITSVDFSGQVVATYGVAEDMNAYPPLLMVDYREAVLTEKQKYKLQCLMPLTIQPGVEQAFGTTRINVTEQSAELDFENDFWEPYGLKHNKDRAIKEWKKLSAADQALAVFCLPAYLRHLQFSTYGRAKVGADKYLNKKYWLTKWDYL